MVKKILLTGGGGFLGSHLISSSIFADHITLSLNRKKVSPSNGTKQLLGDVRKKQNFEGILEENDIVIHLACLPITESEKYPKSSFKTNYLGTKNIAKACREIGAILVNISSTEVYGNSNGKPITETGDLKPLSTYGHHKLNAELYCRSQYIKGNLNYINLRLSNIFGLSAFGDIRSTVETIFLKHAKENKVITIKGGPHSSRDFISIKDVLVIIRNVVLKTQNNLNAINGETFNVASGQEVPLLDLAKKACGIYGLDKDKCVKILNREQDTIQFIGDTKKTQNFLGHYLSDNVFDFMEKIANSV